MLRTTENINLPKLNGNDQSLFSSVTGTTSVIFNPTEYLAYNQSMIGINIFVGTIDFISLVPR